MDFRAQIAFQMDSALPRDQMTINPHYFGDNAQALADSLKSNLLATSAVGATHPFSIKIYDAEKAPPSYPLAHAETGGTFSTNTTPRELALCLSYYALYNRPGRRGRLYIPFALIGGALGLRPTTGQQTSALSWGAILTKNLPADHYLEVWSRKQRLGWTVTNFWVDDEWDIMRSRGLRGTSRALQATPFP